MDGLMEIKGKPAKLCEEPEDDLSLGRFAMAIFGGAGDLAQRKLLPALYLLYLKGRIGGDFTLVGLGHTQLTDETYRELAGHAVKEFLPGSFDEKKCAEFVSHFGYLSGDMGDAKLYAALSRKLAGCSAAGGAAPNIVLYLAVPPDVLETITVNLGQSGLCAGALAGKIIVEKPFGADRASAARLNALLRRSFSEDRIYRIDHYLGKDTVQNMLYFRFGNSIFEPLWNRRYIDHVQITVAEEIGIEHRGRFYEQAGVVRDIIQNHMMQLLALTAMEPPVGFDADRIRDEKVKVLRTVRPAPANGGPSAVFGQYGPGNVGGAPAKGYRQEDRVSPASDSPTFFCGKFFLDSWRWSGVPFYLRSGKRLPCRRTAIHVQFKAAPLQIFGGSCEALEPNALVFDIEPREKISLLLNVKQPGISRKLSSVDMELDYEDSFGARQHSPYERLLIDCVRGDLTLFAREDEVDTTWSIIDPLMKSWQDGPRPEFPNYAAGSPGPEEAALLMERDGRRWRDI